MDGWYLIVLMYDVFTSQYTLAYSEKCHTQETAEAKAFAWRNRTDSRGFPSYRVFVSQPLHATPRTQGEHTINY